MSDGGIRRWLTRLLTYEAFLKAMRHACIEVPMRVLAYCLMPNHFHLVVWPIAADREATTLWPIR